MLRLIGTMLLGQRSRVRIRHHPQWSWGAAGSLCNTVKSQGRVGRPPPEAKIKYIFSHQVWACPCTCPPCLGWQGAGGWWRGRRAPGSRRPRTEWKASIENWETLPHLPLISLCGSLFYILHPWSLQAIKGWGWLPAGMKDDCCAGRGEYDRKQVGYRMTTVWVRVTASRKGRGWPLGGSSDADPYELLNGSGT